MAFWYVQLMHQQHVAQRVARDDPLVAAREDEDLSGALVVRKLERLDRAGAAADDDDGLAARRARARQLAGVVDGALERVHAGQARDLGLAAGADGQDDAVEGKVEVVHEGVDLQRGGAVDPAPEAAELVLAARFEDGHVEAMPNVPVCCTGNAGDAGIDDCSPGPAKARAGIWG